MKKKTSKQLQKQIWELCKQIIRKRHGPYCYTCGKGGLVGSNWHTGHMIAKAACGAKYKYDLRFLRPQCMRCNCELGGMGAIFMAKMMLEDRAAVEEILSERQKIVMSSKDAYEHYENLVEEYKKLL